MFQDRMDRKGKTEFPDRDQLFAYKSSADRLKLAFFTHISHELRTPLTLIKAPLDEIRNGQAGRFRLQKNYDLILLTVKAGISGEYIVSFFQVIIHIFKLQRLFCFFGRFGRKVPGLVIPGRIPDNRLPGSPRVLRFFKIGR